MSKMNAHTFDELDKDSQNQLLDYIYDSFVTIPYFNQKRSAYGLKQPYTRLYPNPEYHITSQCFMEAMVRAGYKAKLVSKIGEPNWYFNAKLIKK